MYRLQNKLNLNIIKLYKGKCIGRFTYIGTNLKFMANYASICGQCPQFPFRRRSSSQDMPPSQTSSQELR